MKMRAALLLTVLLLPLAFTAQTTAGDAQVSALRTAAQDLAAGRLDAADAELQALINTNPENYRALNLLGILRAEQHRDDEARQIFQKVIEHAPEMASAHVNLGLLYAQTSHEDEAISEFHEALRIEPGRDDALHALVNLLRTEARATAAADPEKALSRLIEARKIAPEDPDVLYDFGMVAIRMSLFKDAVDAFRGALAVRADDPATLYGFGRAQMGLTQYQDARETFSKYLSLKPNDASAHYAAGLTLAALQLPADAQKEFAESIRLQPVQTESYFQLALLQLDAKELEGAAENLNRVLSRDGHHAGALGAMGRLEFERKNYPKALEYLQQSIAAQSQQRQAHYYLGLTYARLGQKEQSSKELQIASEIEHAEAEKQRTGLHIENPPQ